MSPGGLLLRFRQWSRHGLVTAYYRDVVRPRILSTAPIRGTTDRRCELHVLTSRKDWLNLIWSLKSFYRFSQRGYSLCIHEDGTVPQEGLRQLRHHFPEARLVLRASADERAERELRQYPRSMEFRRTNLLAPKVFDFISYLESERMLLFDSDLLFFDAPGELLRRIDDPSYSIEQRQRRRRDRLYRRPADRSTVHREPGRRALQLGTRPHPRILHATRLDRGVPCSFRTSGTDTSGVSSRLSMPCAAPATGWSCCPTSTRFPWTGPSAVARSVITWE